MKKLPQKKSDKHPKLGFREQLLFASLGFLMSFDYYLGEEGFWVATINSLWTLLMLMGILYLNYYVLIPAFFKKKRYVHYAIACLGAAGAYILVQRWSGMEEYLCGENSWHGVFSTAVDWALYLLLSTLFWYMREFQTEKERQSQLKGEKLEAELKFLRAQISPHFIFNALNNIYSLASLGHPNAAPMVARLADILRYMLYENTANTTPLAHELEAVQQFIELHRLRNLVSNNIDFYTEGNPNGFTIPPILLLNFVENCFKHGQLDQDEQAWIRIEAEINPDGVFSFTTENSIPVSRQKEDSGFGIGLENARRQLELNYPGRHSLDTGSENGVFKVSLRLEL